MPAPHDAPTASELLAAVREWLDGAVSSGEPVSRFHALVASNMLSIVAREIDLGPEQASRHRRRLDALGVPDDAALAALIRTGELGDRAEQVRDAVLDAVLDKLAVANPGYADRRPSTTG